MKRLIVGAGAFLLGLGAVGCSGADPLIGRWALASSGVAAEIDFRADGTTTDDAVVTDAGTGCVTTVDTVSRFSDDGKSLSLTPQSFTQSVAGCTDPAKDAAAATTDLTGAATTQATYTIDGDALTLVSSYGTVTYSRK